MTRPAYLRVAPPLEAPPAPPCAPRTPSLPPASGIIWLRCRGYFIRTPGTWPEQQARMVASALEEAGLTVLVQLAPMNARGAHRLCQAMLARKGTVSYAS
jgi:hypothetical protein